MIEPSLRFFDASGESGGLPVLRRALTLVLNNPLGTFCGRR